MIPPKSSASLVAVLLALVCHPASAEEKKAPGLRAGHCKSIQFSYNSNGGVERKRTIFLWYPTEQEEAEHKYVRQRGMAAVDAPVKAGRAPLVLFSHGFWGGAEQSVFLMEALARSGYIVASLHHDDAIPNQAKKRIEMPNFINAKGWKEDKFFDRREDMTALLDELIALDGKEDSMLHERIDREAVGAAGHSLGGYTILGMAGARESWKDDRLKAALLLSPYILPYYHHGDPAAVKIPVMFQGGTLDVGITPFLKRMYEKLETPKYYLVLKGVDHYGWTDFNSVGRTTTAALEKGNPKLMADYSIAFFDQHLRGLDRTEALVNRDDALHGWWADP